LVSLDSQPFPEEAVTLPRLPGARVGASSELDHTAASGALTGIRQRHAEDERDRIVAALEASGGNVSEAARRLEISRHQLVRRIAKYKLG
jgi:transcriptional regulator with GAF, ATPase, and Fis domain